MKSVLWGLGMGTVVALAGCAANGSLAEDSAGAGERDEAAALPPTANALVLGIDQLRWQEGRSVLEAMRAELPSVHIRETSGCPEVAMRGPNPAPGMTEPTVYVDGAPAINTCILEDLSTDLIAQVEVYPSGFTPRPGYTPNGNGLILLFTRHARGDRGAALGVRH